MDKYYDDYEIDTSGALTKKITELYPSAEVYAVIIYDDFNKSKKVLGDVFHYVAYLPDRKVFVDINGVYKNTQEVINFWINYHNINKLRYKYFEVKPSEFNLPKGEPLDVNLVNNSETLAKHLLEKV